MARLYRPHVPIAVKIMVAEHEMVQGRWTLRLGHHQSVAWGPRDGARRLASALAIVAANYGCDVKDLRLDHDPPLALRPKERRGLGRRTYYVPDANDPKYLKYRPHGAQFDGSHDVKTRIRGEHGQYSDIALIKRERRRQRREKPPTERQARMAKIREQQKELRRKIARQRKRKAGKVPKHKWQSRPFRSKKSPRRFGGQ